MAACAAAIAGDPKLRCEVGRWVRQAPNPWLRGFTVPEDGLSQCMWWSMQAGQQTWWAASVLAAVWAEQPLSGDCTHPCFTLYVPTMCVGVYRGCLWGGSWSSHHRYSAVLSYTNHSVILHAVCRGRVAPRAPNGAAAGWTRGHVPVLDASHMLAQQLVCRCAICCRYLGGRWLARQQRSPQNEPPVALAVVLQDSTGVHAGA